MFPAHASGGARHGPRKARAPKKQSEGSRGGHEGEGTKTVVLGSAPGIPTRNVPGV
eukprot:CAMPEP_0119210466 /NCGR_PEP_ID=MMETSP1327-20130426/2265_1 /TAXON_ID=38833 /ORGANISM="Micromonas pusilla, Strain RCC2306" /LENGTH=55 /DNA_ID=CAMNT_0007207483 /DNA_START=225 /DNA_END=392 /DNA_ORIENTATION=+